VFVYPDEPPILVTAASEPPAPHDAAEPALVFQASTAAGSV
jgi:hypothetical protein